MTTSGTSWATLREVDARLDHGAIGNGRLIALVAPTSAIEWLCLPRFDSPSVFAALLDPHRGGRFQFLARRESIRGTASYLPNTNVLRTEFVAGEDRWEVLDFAPRIPQGGGRFETPLEVIRVVRPLAGTPRITVEFSPRPNYGREPGRLLATQHGVEVLDADAPMHLFTNVPGDHICGKAEIPVRHPLYFMLSYGPRHNPPTESDVMLMLNETIRGWRLWSKTCALPSFAPGHVLRSALCLKLHAYVDTGAIIAAATTSIPEAIGTPRTWDYRYCWLRDAAFVVEALRRLSHLNEGEQFIGFLRDIAESGPLQPLYGIGGERELPEQVLEHLTGFAGTGPVRIGNAAAEQQQNDLNGELILCLQTVMSDPRIVLDQPQTFFPLVERLVEQAIALAPLADTGIWEFRTLPRHYTFSRAMCWAAIDRGAMIAARMGRTDLAGRWAAVAAEEREIVLRRGFNARVGCFTQSLEGEHGDAANLLFPSIGLVDARDPRFLATLDHYGRHMTRSGLMQRYTNLDDFGATTSAFTICSFWWAEALALAGRLEEAVALFHRIVAHANPLGLFSEDIEPETGALLGNFPQAYTHVGLIHAAMTIGTLLDVRDGRVRAWI
ncbi:MAG TPA: glycoside hydrolase family 15 protein [Kofleriaceae bacterium]|nr:glycoside hydrolase family 15 protein [Kofleriaceae bacterium]